MSYHALANWYDKLMEHVPYDQWIQFTESKIQKHEIAGKKIVDLGSGTGEIAIRLAEKGYDVTAVDLSEEMLMVGMDKALKKQLHIQWIKQNIVQLEGFQHIDVFVSYLDVLNYITDVKDLEKLFMRVFEALNPNGLFMFDIHHLPFMETDRGNQTFVDESDDIMYIWECQKNTPRGRYMHYLTFFLKQSDGMYKRYEEVHEQQVFPIEIYRDLLQAVGFSKITILPNILDENSILDDENERNFIIAQK